MRTRLFAVFAAAGILCLSLSMTDAQESPTPKVPSPPPAFSPAVSTTPVPTAPPALKPIRDLTRLTGLQQQMLLSAQRGADWLFRMHGVKGRFRPGYSPALGTALEGDSFFRQAGAAFALARAARFCGEERYAVRAAQAALSLLEETATDTSDARSRHASMPPAVAHRLGATAALVLVISELPKPESDLLDRADEMCRYLVSQQAADGSFAPAPGASAKDELAEPHPATAVHALMLSHKKRPAEWKVAAVRKALAYYRAEWKKQPRAELAPGLVAACAELVAVGKDKAAAEFTCEIGDSIAALQYVQIDPRRNSWYGGFMTFSEGKPFETAPDVTCGRLVEALAEASRVAKSLNDAARTQTYAECVERGSQFLATLQYTDAVAQHYQPWFRPQILGAFHASHQDGNLRIDHTQAALCGLVGYLEHVAK